jgi:PAS domain-containing protein
MQNFLKTNEKQKDLLVKQIVNRKKIEQSLIDSELHLKTILLSEPECIKMVDKNGKLLDMNPAGLAMIEADNLEMVKGQNNYLLLMSLTKNSLIN